MQGIDDLKGSRKGKLTLRTITLKEKPRPRISAAEIVSLREKLHVSRPVFAAMIRTSPRTLERWEQNKGKPDQGSATLLKLIEAHPETLDMIAKL
jgi:putative transcriptional regulator